MTAPTRAERESAGEKLRFSTKRFTPYRALHPQSFSPSTGWTRDLLLALVRQESLEYFEDQDKRRDMTVARPFCVFRWLSSWVDDRVNETGQAATEILEKVCCFSVPPGLSLRDVFDPLGFDASAIATRSGVRAFTDERSRWTDLIIRAHTLYHNGASAHFCSGYTDQPTLDELPAAAAKGFPTDSKTRFQNAARKYKVPSEEDIRSAMPQNGSSASSHPYLAAARHLTVVSLRAVARSLGAVQCDPCIGPATAAHQRDYGAFGDSPVNTLKDLARVPVPMPSAEEEKIGNGDHKVVKTLFDCLGYEDSLSQHSGYDMIIWASFYPELAGETCESVYYADSAETFVEIVGKDQATANYEKQYAWDFTPSDIVYIENEDKTAFTVYNVVRYPQPNLLKQVVFLCALQTVNLPYAIVNQLVRWTKGHDLDAVGIRTPKRCDNVVLVPRDPKRPYTQDILVMANGTPGRPTASIKYKNATSPRSCTTMKTELYDYLRYVNAHGGRGLNVTEVIKRLELFIEEEFDTPGTAAYCELLRTVSWWGELPNAVYYPLPCKPQDVPTEVDSAKGVLAGPNITGNSPSVVVKTPGAMDAYVEKKMIGKRNKTQPPADYIKASDLVLSTWLKCIEQETGIGKGTVQLVDRELILGNRTKAIQRARFVTDGLGPTQPEIGRVETKVEASHKTGECPRGIQNPNYDISIASGVLGKTLEIVLKKTHWYNPGLNPDELAQRVQECYSTSHTHELHHMGGGVRSVDYTAADDSHSQHSNRITRALIDYFLFEGDKGAALEIYDSCFNMPLQVGPRVMSSLWKNASGTGITTVLNTVNFSLRELETSIVASVFKSMRLSGELDEGAMPRLLHYSTFLEHLRKIQKTWELEKITTIPAKLRRQKSVKFIEAAYHWIGPKFGDDGLAPATPYVDDAGWRLAMDFVDLMDGFERKLETTSAVRDEPVEYLSRVYPCPSRTLSSYCKVAKALDKLSIAVNRDREKFILKLRGYWTVDKYAPIVGAYLIALAKMYGVDLSDLGDGKPITHAYSILLPDDCQDKDMRRIYEEDRELYMKVAGGPYPWDPNSSDLCYEAVAEEYGMTSGELREFDQDLANQSTWNGIQSKMLPKKIMEAMDDPLGLHEKPDPPGVAKVAAAIGAEPRMCNFESKDGATDQSTNDAARTEAALSALRL